MNQFFERGERRKQEEHERSRHYTSLAIGAFIALTGLTILIINQKLYTYTLITVFLIIILLVLISGFWGYSIALSVSEFFKKRRYNNLAKSKFEEFKKLVIRFGDLTENWPSNIQTIIKDIKGTTPFTQITGVEPIRIQELYKYYNKHLDQFNGTEDDLIILVREFESILYMYDDVYIKEPTKQVKNIGSDKIPKSYRDRYVNAQKKYTAFIMDYNAFAKIANEDFKEKEEALRLFRDTFEPPEDL